MSVYIVSAARTPIGKSLFITFSQLSQVPFVICNHFYEILSFFFSAGNFNGAVSKLSAADLGAVVIKEVLARSKTEPADVDEVILGQALTAAAGQNPARQAALKAGIPQETPAYLVNLLCGSGLKTVYLGYQAIKCGDSSIVISGGQESMTQAPHAVQLRAGIKLGSAQLIDTMVNDGLTDAFSNIHMGLTAENVAKKYNVTREQQDVYAAHSQQMAETAQKNGYFESEIVGVSVPNRAGAIVFDKDEYLKYGTTTESLAELRPVFDRNGTVTAGNASGLNDSAATVLLMSQNEVEKRDAQPLAKIIAFGQSGCDPQTMGMGAADAVEIVVSETIEKCCTRMFSLCQCQIFRDTFLISSFTNCS